MRRRTCTVFSILVTCLSVSLSSQLWRDALARSNHNSVDFRIGRIVITNNVKCMYGVSRSAGYSFVQFPFETWIFLFRKNSHDAFD